MLADLNRFLPIFAELDEKFRAANIEPPTLIFTDASAWKMEGMISRCDDYYYVLDDIDRTSDLAAVRIEGLQLCWDNYGVATQRWAEKCGSAMLEYAENQSRGEEVKTKPDIRPVGCPKHCFQGYIGMDNCNICGQTGSVFRVDGKIFPNTKEGYIKACAAAGIEPTLNG